MYFYFLLKKKINSVNFNPLRSFKRQQLIKNIPLFLKKKQHVSFVALYDGIIRMSQRVITCVQFLNIDTNYTNEFIDAVRKKWLWLQTEMTLF